jgi:hypothetical protein
MAKKSISRNRGRGKHARSARVFGQGAELVRQAASILDQEMAVGVTAAKAVQQRLDREQKIDPADFRNALQRFQGEAHALVNSLNAQLAQDKLPQNVELAKRYITRANDLIDLTVGVVTTSSELANDLLRTNLTKANVRSNRKGRAR